MTRATRLACIPRIPAVVFAAGMFLLVLGCGGGASTATPVATDAVDLPPSYRFDPPFIRVAAGTTVTWTNSDNFTHSVALDGASDPLAIMKPGESASFTFDDPGRYPYVCSVHPQDMTGVVEVIAP